MKIKLDPGAIRPIRAYPTDAGLDLSSRDDDFMLWPGSSYVFDTGVHIQLPEGTCGLIMSRSGLNIKHGIVAAGNGVIDQEYTGSIGVKLFNMGSVGRVIKKGDRIAQLLIMECKTPTLEVVDELEETNRGDARYGSTGR